MTGREREQNCRELGDEEVKSTLLYFLISEFVEAARRAGVVEKFGHVARQRSVAATRTENTIASIQKR